MNGVDTSFEVVVPATKRSFRLSDNGGLDHIVGLVRENGLADYERPLPVVMAWMVHAMPGAMLDVGANTGLFSLLVAAANQQTRVFAFEPLESVRDLLKTNIAQNSHLAARIGVYDIGLSNAAGTFDFFETINEHGLVTTSSSLEETHAERIGRYKKQRVQTQTLDDWSTAHDLASISIIKIDVEGHEYAVIEGGRRTIKRYRPFMTIEVLQHARIDSIEMMMFEDAYTDLVITRRGFRHVGKLAFHDDGWNHLLCPTERLSVVLSACHDLGLQLEIA